MKVVLLAGGKGTRISEMTGITPKPMIEVGGMPLLWHIMKLYGYYGLNDFIICAGYKQHIVKQWFDNYFLYTSDITFDFSSDKTMTVLNKKSENWKVTIVDTGEETMTGGRIKRVADYLDDEFLVTYGDGLSDVNIKKLIETHHNSGQLGTITIYNPGQRFGIVDFDADGNITHFREKSNSDGALINIGYMVMNKKVLDYVKDDMTIFEREPLEKLAQSGQLHGYKHEGFWQCVDTKRDYDFVNDLWETGDAPWKVCGKSNAKNK